MEDQRSNGVAAKVIPHNELATESKMTMQQIVKGLSDLQDELHAKGLDEAAILLHRALNKVTASALNVALLRKMQSEKRSA